MAIYNSSDIGATYESIQPRYPELRGHVAIVTGSSRGIGVGIALWLAREGMRVVINGRSAADVQATTRELKGLGAEALAIPADVGQQADCQRLIDETLAAFGAIDLLVNNAADLRRFHFYDDHDALALLDSQLASNVRGPYVLAYLSAEEMRRSGSAGSIVNISSVGGLRAHWRGLPYDMTKGAIDGMTRAMALDLSRYGIRVNAVAPGATQTERTPDADDPRVQEVARRVPLGRFGTPLDIGAAVAFLASPDAAYITGQVLYVDGGITTQLSPPSCPV